MLKGFMTTQLTIQTPFCELTIRKNAWIFGSVSFGTPCEDPQRIYNACSWAEEEGFVAQVLGHWQPDIGVTTLIASLEEI